MSPVVSNTELLEAKDLVKIYSGKRVVDQIDLSINRKEIVGLLGPNGAGKTTTFYMIIGLTKSDGGNVYLNGEKITNDPMFMRARKGINYLPQEPSIFRKLNVEQNLLAIMESIDIPSHKMKGRLKDLLSELNISHLAKQKASYLSGGERRRLEIARILVTEPKLLLLDEPFSGVDPIAVEEIQKIIRHLKKKGMGILITDHNVRETLTITDRSYIVHEGRILQQGDARQLIADEQVRRAYLGESFVMPELD